MAREHVPHGDASCLETERFWCVLCTRLACWCTGASDDVDDLIAQQYQGDVPTGDPGLCDECWASMARDGGPVANVEWEVA